jgi:predicted dehydrogenase
VRILIAGPGSIGGRHLRNLRKLGAEDIVVLRRSPVPVPGNEDISVLTNLDEALATNPDLVLVCTPATEHLRIANAAVEAGCHLFVEKPLCGSWAGVEDLLTKVKAAGKVGMAGFDLRFDRGLHKAAALVESERIGQVLAIHAQVGQYLPDWRPGTDYRRGITARSDLGGGVILELIHELDIVSWLAGPIAEVGCIAGKVSDLQMDVEDTAEVVLRFSSGAVGSVHLDCIDRTPVRLLRVIGSKGTLVWDGVAQTLDWQKEGEEWQRFDWTSQNRNARFTEEMICLIDCVRSGNRPPVDLDGAAATLRAALAARRSAKEKRMFTPGDVR